MNSTIFQRILWKELRMQWAFGVALIALAVFLQLITLGFMEASARTTDWIFMVGMGFAALYAMGTGATLFATEKETGTFELHRMMPVSWAGLFAGKVAYAAISTMIAMFVLWLASIVLAGWRLPEAEVHAGLWILFGMGTIEMLAWGIFFSLLCETTTKAAILGITAASVSVQLVFLAFDPDIWNDPSWAVYTDPSALPYRAAIVVLLALANVYLARRWFLDQRATTSAKQPGIFSTWWTELRRQRCIFGAVFLLSVLSTAVLLALSGASRDRYAYDIAFLVAYSLAALYALICGASLFAASRAIDDRDERPARVLLPPFFGKLLFAVLSTLALLYLPTILVIPLKGIWTHAPSVSDPWRVREIALDALLWSLFFSLVFRRTVATVLLTLPAVFLSIWGLHSPGTFLLYDQPHPTLRPQYIQYFPGWCQNGFSGGSDWLTENFVAGAVVLGVIGLGIYRYGFRPTRIAADGQMRGPIGAKAAPSSGLTVFGRLVWQQWRQSRGMLVVVGGLVALAAFAVSAAWKAHLSHDNRYEILTLAVVMLATLMGASVFAADQRTGRARLLGYHGVSPTLVWLSRQLVWGTALLTLVVAICPMFCVRNYYLSGEHQNFYSGRYIYNHTGWYWVLIDQANEISFFVACAILAYGGGQLCSMFFRSGLLSLVFGTMTAGLLCGWAFLVWFWGVGIWAVVPPAVIVFAATWLHTNRWFTDRNTLPAALKTAAVFVVAMGLIMTTVAYQRATEIPDGSPGFDVAEFAVPVSEEAEKTLALYARARRAEVSRKELAEADPPVEQNEETEEKWEPTPWSDMAEPNDEDLRYVEANESAIALTMEASRRRECDFFNPHSHALYKHNGLYAYYVELLGLLVVDRARVLQGEGKLDEAFEHYAAALRVARHLRVRPNGSRAYRWHDINPYARSVEKYVYDYLPFWAGHADQSPERIRAAMQEVDRLSQDRPSASDTVKSLYLTDRAIINADPGARVTPQEIAKLSLWGRLLPWERTRADRMLKRVVAAKIWQIQSIESSLLRGKMVSWPSYYEKRDVPTTYTFLDDRHWRESFALRLSANLPGLHTYDTDLRGTAFGLIETEMRRRAVRLQLALCAWRLEHGRLPDSLEELVGTYLDEMPLDVMAGEPFQYFPEGFRNDVFRIDRTGRRLTRNTPLVWSTSGRIQRVDHLGSNRKLKLTGRARYECYQWKDRQRRAFPESDTEFWSHGWLFPIPVLGDSDAPEVLDDSEAE